MKCKALLGLRLLLGALLFAVGSGQTGGFDLVVQQIKTMGPRQWLGLMAGSLVVNAPALAPAGQRIARVLPNLPIGLAAEEISSRDLSRS
jgi:hypothetical protein